MPSVDRALELRSDPDRVWAAITDPEHLGAWLGAEVTIDLRPGGSATFCFGDGPRRRGLVQEVEPGRRLSFTWWPVGPGAAGSPGTVTITLEAPAAGGTVLRLRESARIRVRAAA